MEFSNELTPAQVERLAILLEELGEAQQCIGKILRHGYESRNPLDVNSATNRQLLQSELGDVLYSVMQLGANLDVKLPAIWQRSEEKREKIKPYLHHQSALVANTEHE